MSTEKTKGVLLIALGSPHYGNMAANLASTIRTSDPQLPIHLVWHDKSLDHLTAKHRALFSSMSECPAEAFTKDGKKQYIKSKTWIYDLSPFDETLFIDVDVFKVPAIKLTPIIEKLSEECAFTIQNRGFADLSEEKDFTKATHWCNLNEVKAHYKLKAGKFFFYYSEFIFFKRNDANEKYFARVKELYDHMPPIIVETFATGIPDEICFQLASLELAYYPHHINKVWVLFWLLQPYHDWNKVIADHAFISLGGKELPLEIKNKGKLYCDHAASRLQLGYSYPIQNKKSWDPTRQKV